MQLHTRRLLFSSFTLLPLSLSSAQADLWELSSSLGPSLVASGRLDGDHAHPWTASRPDGHAPIGVMGDHVHAAGEWMVSLRVMSMHMEGMRDGTSDLSSAEVFAEGFAVTPTEMDTQMVMLGGMYAVSDDLTLMLMAPYLQKTMDHRTGMGATFETEAEGFGDLRLGGLYNIYDAVGSRVHLNLGLSLPIGSVDERDDTPAMADAKLPYPMQLGSGTFDVIPGVTYLAQRDAWSWGAQGNLRIHLGDNDEGWSHGTAADLTGWLARAFGDLSASLRLAALHRREIRGRDDDLNPAMVPTADPDNFGGNRVDAAVGLNWYGSEGALAGHRFAIEVGSPVFQDTNGPQLESDWMVTLGWQLAR